MRVQIAMTSRERHQERRSARTAARNVSDTSEVIGVYRRKINLDQGMTTVRQREESTGSGGNHMTAQRDGWGMRVIIMAVIAVAAAFVLTSAVGAQPTRYVDERGAHWVQAPAQVPEQYRAKATQPDLPKLKDAKVYLEPVGRLPVEHPPTLTREEQERLHAARVQQILNEKFARDTARQDAQTFADFQQASAQRQGAEAARRVQLENRKNPYSCATGAIVYCLQ